MSTLWAPAPEAGTTYRSCLVERLTRRHVAEYAGASGDFNLVHVDEAFAVEEAGRPSVIAHGMLTMGLTASFVTGLTGHDALRTFRGRFLRPVLPGQRLTSTAVVQEVTADLEGWSVSLQATTYADDEPVFEGYVLARRG